MHTLGLCSPTHRRCSAATAVFIILAAFAPLAHATTYWIATTGNDTTGDGTTTNPWQTIQKGADMAQPGDVVNVKAGTYAAGAVLPRSGTSGARIVFQKSPYAALGAVVIDGDNFKSVGNSYITISGFKITNTFYAIDIQGPASIIQQAENATLSGGVLVKTQWSGYTGAGYVDYPTSGGYIEFTVNVPTANTYTLEFRYTNGGGSARTLTRLVNGGGSMVMSFPATATSGTWSYVTANNVQLAAGNNTVRMTGGGSPGGPDIDKLVVTRATGVTGINVSNNWTYETGGSGIKVFGTLNSDSPRCATGVVSDLTIGNNRIEEACNGTVQKNECISVGQGVQDFEIHHNEVIGGARNGGTGGEGIDVKHGAGFGSIHHNIIRDRPMEKINYYIEGGQWGCHDIEVYNNIGYNLAGDAMTIRAEGYQPGGFVSNLHVYNNLLYDGAKAGIRLDTAVNPMPLDNIKIVNNTIYNCGGIGLNVANAQATNITFRNNIIYGSGQVDINKFNAGGGFVSDHNLFGTHGATYTPHGTDKVNPGVTTYQAESATLAGGAIVKTQWAGYSGTGYVDYPTSGGYIQFTVNAPCAGTYFLAFRYTNGSGSTRTLTRLVNGGGSTVMDFPATATWGTWADVKAHVTLNAGNNTVRITAGSSPGGPDIDRLTVAQGPGFVNVGAENFHLTSCSPARDTGLGGLANDAPTTDYDGVARPQGAAHDIGAFEFVSGP